MLQCGLDLMKLFKGKFNIMTFRKNITVTLSKMTLSILSRTTQHISTQH